MTELQAGDLGPSREAGIILVRVSSFSPTSCRQRCGFRFLVPFARMREILTATNLLLLDLCTSINLLQTLSRALGHFPTGIIAQIS